MKRTQTIKLRQAAIAFLLALTSLAAIPALADRDHDHRDHFRSRHWEFDARHHHDHYYPSRGYVFTTLPPGHVAIAYGRHRYFFQGGVWFRASGPRFVVVTPPAGIIVPVLPPVYTTVWVAGAPYYYANGVYYAPSPSHGYTVVEPPRVVAEEVSPPPPAPVTAADTDLLFVYPRSGQSDGQIAADRRECERWASNQSGYDPARRDSRGRGDFNRAITACLEGRGYTVR